MAESPLQDHLQPSLLDRLIDDAPMQTKEAPERQVMRKDDIRNAVLRDLEWLFNTARLGGEVTADRFPEAARSVINYGLPAFSGQFASALRRMGVEASIKQVILDFEPRILPKTLDVRLIFKGSLLNAHNRVGLYIRGLLWAQPAPIEFLLRTRLDLEAGRIALEDMTH